MNAWIILLFLLLNQSNGCNTDCGCGNGRGRDRDRDREPDRGRDRDRDRDRDGDCGCDEQDSRFEPRFEARPFGGRETCGCEGNNE